MDIRIASTKRWNLTNKLQRWLHHLVYDFDVSRLNPPIRSVLTHKQDGKRYEEILDDPDWIFMGYVPQPESTLGWFWHHLIHGLIMRYPLRSVLAFSILHAVPDRNRVSNMKPNRLDVWLNDEDIKRLHKLAKHYQAPRQRIIESALAQLSVEEVADKVLLEDYKQTIPLSIRFDALAREQLNHLVDNTNLSNQDVLRLALKKMNSNNLSE